MVELHIVVIIGSICACLGAVFMALCLKSSETNEMVQDIIDRAKAIPGALEEIVQACIDHVGCEHDVDTGNSFYPGHHDIAYDIDEEGEAKIRTILEGM